MLFNNAEEEEKIQLRAHLGMLNQPKIARTAKWGDFLDDMMNMYPLRHRINLDAQQKLIFSGNYSFTPSSISFEISLQVGLQA